MPCRLYIGISDNTQYTNMKFESSNKSCMYVYVSLRHVIQKQISDQPFNVATLILPHTATTSLSKQTTIAQQLSIYYSSN